MPTPTPTPTTSTEESEALVTTFTLRGTFTHTASGYLAKNGKVQTILVCDGLASNCRQHVLIERPLPTAPPLSARALAALARDAADPPTGEAGCWIDGVCAGTYRDDDVTCIYCSHNWPYAPATKGGTNGTP